MLTELQKLLLEELDTHPRQTSDQLTAALDHEFEELSVDNALIDLWDRQRVKPAVSSTQRDPVWELTATGQQAA